MPTQYGRPLLWLVVLGLYLSYVSVGESAGPQGNRFPLGHGVIDAKAELESIVWQTTDRTCGPATLATLLRFYFGELVTEQELYELSLQAMFGDSYQSMGSDTHPSITIRGLKGALGAYDFQGYPVATSLDNLESYFSEYEVPVILRIYHPEPHFTLLIGSVGGLFILADSMLGHVTMTGDELTSHWDNYAMFVMPGKNIEFNSTIRDAILLRVEERLAMLHRVRMSL